MANHIPHMVLVSKVELYAFLQFEGWQLVDSVHTTKDNKEVPMKKLKDPLSGQLYMPNQALSLYMQRRMAGDAG